MARRRSLLSGIAGPHARRFLIGTDEERCALATALGGVGKSPAEFDGRARKNLFNVPGAMPSSAASAAKVAPPARRRCNRAITEGEISTRTWRRGMADRLNGWLGAGQGLTNVFNIP